MKTQHMSNRENSKREEYPSWVAIIVGLAMNSRVISREEHDLEARFGEAYRDYKEKVPRWFGRQ
jgi:protein-S-isoprenylcysteine O-methyltransferase Ste14